MRSRLRKVRVRAPSGFYDVLIDRGAVAALPAMIRRHPRPSRVHVVADRRVWHRHAARVRKALAESGFPFAVSLVPAGERSKCVGELEKIWRRSIRAGLDRRGLFVALGGGMVGDLTGFAAATVLRGVSFLQVPTTLLAMVDASVGGKTGINVPEGKNLVGAFHQPRAVVMDLDFLSTLPARELRAGWAETIKTAAIRDEALFHRMERDGEALRALETSALTAMVARCVAMKAAVVEADEREAGLRMVLNFGHTLAHGIETAQGYGGLLHGEAVAVGMIFAARLGERLGVTERGAAERLEAICGAYGLPVRLRGLAPSRILSAMARDKKRGPRGLRWVLLVRVGMATVVEDVPERVVVEELRRFLRRGT